MSIHTLIKVDFEDLIIKCNLDEIVVPLNNLGVTVNQNYTPFSEQLFIDKIYKDYIQRENWFNKYVQGLKSIDQIIWSEASRAGNNQYVYHIQKNGKFKYQIKQPGYFKNVKEAIFNKSLVVDFLSPFGINHSASTRNEFYKLLCSNKHYRAYFIEYYNSIIKTLSFPLINKPNVIVAPGNTKKLILDFLRGELKITTDIKSYDIDDRGAKDTSSYL